MIRIANAPCSWGVLEFDLAGETAGYAKVLDEMAETGYVGTELGDWGFLPTEPIRLKQELMLRNLELVGAFVPVMLKDPAARAAGVEIALRTARLLAGVSGKLYSQRAAPFIVLADENGKDVVRTQNAGRIQPGQGLSTDEWQVAAQTVDTIARAVRKETGLLTVFHHHCAGYVETPSEVDMLLHLTDPEMVGLCLDTGHYRFGGGDPLECLQRNFSRIWHVHFKDCQPELAQQARLKGWDYFTSVQKGIFCELGCGEIDFASIKHTLEARGYGAGASDGWIVVEQDVLPGMGSPKESAYRNRIFLDKIGFTAPSMRRMVAIC